MTRRLTLLISALVTCLMLLPAGSALARSHKPKITYVTPMRVSVGGKLTVRGRGFSRRRLRNTLILRGPNRRFVFVKPRRASAHRLVVILPSSAQRLLSIRDGSRRATRLKMRVAVRRRFGRWTSSRTSPVVVPTSGGSSPAGSTGSTGGSGGSVTPATDCGSGSDWDGDLLLNTTEKAIGTDPCNRDSDGDGVEDGYEYQSAKDLNYYPGTTPLPYPGKRPYPNALDPTDANTDYDGDGLTQRDEYLAWVNYSADGVARSGRPTTLSNLLYSDGLQRSRSVSAPDSLTDPLGAWVLDNSGPYGALPTGDGVLDDGERDVDGDGIGNWDEQHGRFTESWWVLEHDGVIEPLESKYPNLNFLDNADLPTHDALVDPDIDGDGVLDGADDYDHDGLSNEFELVRPGDWFTQAWGADPAANSWAYVQPFNPCKPFASDRCQRYAPFHYYDSDGASPFGPAPPAGYPAIHPDTPNG